MLLAFANLTFGHGSYQRTKDGRTFVWNNFPQPGDTAIWSGYRDREGYATGFGTLSWYTLQDEEPSKPTLYARYFGRMVRGKFNGPVNVHLNDRTIEHALFIDGEQTTRWAMGPAPSWRIPQSRITHPEPAHIAGSRAVEPETPAEGPPPPAIPPPPVAPGEPPSTNRFADDVDHSLRILAFPPASLRTRQAVGALPNETAQQAATPPTVNARLSKEEVINLADSQARADGYDLAQFQHSEPQYDPIDGIWSLFYEQKSDVGIGNSGKHFAVAVDDKRKKASIGSAH